MDLFNKPLKKKLLIGSALAFLGLSGVALSQSAPTVALLHPTDLIQVIPFGQPSAQSKYALAPAITNQFGYYKSVPGAGFAYTIGTNVTYTAFNPGGTLASGYTTLPPAPPDGARTCVFSTQTITAFYVAANTGQSITNFGGYSNGGSSTALTANVAGCWLYSASNTTWDRD